MSLKNQSKGQTLSEEDLVQRWLPVLRVLVVVLGVGILAAVAYLVWNSVQERRAEKAFSALSVADGIEDRSLKEFSPSQATEKQEFLQIAAQWPDSKKQEYVEALQKVIKDYNDESALASAALRLGAFYLATKDFAKAEGVYQDLTGRVKSQRRVVFRALAYEGLAMAQEAQGKNEEALQTFTQFAGLKDNPIEPLALMGQARIYQNLGKLEDAAKAYDRVIKDFAGSAYERQARVLQSLLKNRRG